MRRLALAAIVVLALLLMVPNVAFVFASAHLKNPAWVIGNLAVPAGLLLALFAVLGRRPWLACLVLAPFAALVPTVALYISRYRTPITEAVLGTVAATNLAEAASFLGPWLWLLLTLSLVAGTFAVFAGWLSLRANLRFPVPRALHIALTALALLLVMALIGYQMVINQRPPDLADGGNTDARMVRLVQNGYPFGIPVTLGSWWSDQSRLQAAMAKTMAFRFHAHRVSPIGQRQIYVLVIGESSRLNHWQLFGYGRPTNPELSRKKNLVRITGMVSPWPMSLGGVPAIITRRSSRMALEGMFEEGSIVALMREAGFGTWWLSNQDPAGEWNSPITAYANEAQHREWLHLQKYDGTLADGLAKVVHGSRGDLFVVLHMLGSHENYDSRYPPAFEYFSPTIGDSKSIDASYQQINNSYDNSVRYTDHVLSRVIDILRKSDAVTAMWYQSDHGETLPTATCSMADHGHGFRYEFPVPTIFWYSDAYSRAFPEKIATLRENADKRAISSDTFATLTDMAGVQFPGHDVSRSLFSQAWRYRPRMIHPVWQAGNNTVDYDEADLGNGCELVRSRTNPEHVAP